MNGDGNFKMRCINNGSCFDVDSYFYTVGKIYEVKDGFWFDNDGDISGKDTMKTIDNVNEWSDAKFELVEDNLIKEDNPVEERMKKIAEMFNLEFGEEFNIIEKDGEPLDCNPFKFTGNGLTDKDGCIWDSILVALLRSIYTVQKLPWTWKPKDGETIWVVCDGCVYADEFNSTRPNYLSLYKCGWLFHTKKEAEANKDCVLKEYAKVMEK